MESFAHGMRRRVAEPTDTLRKLCLIHRQNLRNIHHAGLRKIALTLLQQHIARRLGLLRLDVIRHTTLVAIALWLNTSFWTTTQG